MGFCEGQFCLWDPGMALPGSATEPTGPRLPSQGLVPSVTCPHHLILAWTIRPVP